MLLVKRGQPPLKGEWSLPGGAVEVGETLAAAIQREVFEETAIRTNEYRQSDKLMDGEFHLVDFFRGVLPRPA